MGTASKRAIVTATVFNGGRVRPGTSAGLLDIVGDYTQGPEGVFDVEIGGLIPNTKFDRLKVGGVASRVRRAYPSQ